MIIKSQKTQLKFKILDLSGIHLLHLLPYYSTTKLISQNTIISISLYFIIIIMVCTELDYGILSCKF